MRYRCYLFSPLTKKHASNREKRILTLANVTRYMLHAKAHRYLNTRWHVIPVLALISTITFIVVYLVCCAEMQLAIPFIKDLVDTGKSFFIPSIPDYNVFWYLPPELHVRVTLGQIVDNSIISFIVSSFFYLGHPYYKALKGRNDLQFMFLDKTGQLKKGTIESPLSKTFLVSNDQTIIVDFKFRLDRGESRERPVKHLLQELLYDEHHEIISGIDFTRGYSARNIASHGFGFKKCESFMVQSSFWPFVYKILLQRILFSINNSNHELSSCFLSEIPCFRTKLYRGGK